MAYFTTSERLKHILVWLAFTCFIMSLSDIKVEEFIPHAAEQHGEGPVWEEKTGRLLYVDIPAKKVHRYDPKTQKREERTIDGEASLIVPTVTDDEYLVTSKRKICHLDWKSSKLTDIVEVPVVSDNGERFNDGKCDAKGRLWAGTQSMKPDNAKLFRLEKDKITPMFSPLSISNGVAWNANNTVMYLVDSTPRHVYAFDFDLANGTLSNKRIAVDFSKWPEKDSGSPDGMSIDTDGNLWIAAFNGGKIIKFDPRTGKRLLDVKIPTPQPTSCCFGGPNYSELFVTTGKIWLPKEDKKRYPKSGSIFRVTGLGVTGTAPFKYDPTA